MNVARKTGVTLLLGPANSGKLGSVLQWWQERLPSRPVLVCPTGPDARELTAEMASRAGALIDQSPAMTFDGLARLLLARSPRYAGALEHELVIARLLAATPTEALQAASRLPGAAVALKALLRQLGESGRTPDELESILARWAAADPGVSSLAGDIRRLVAGYEGLCRLLGIEDRPAAVRGAVEAVRTGVARRLPVAFYGFTSFTPGQRALIEALAQNDEVLVSFTYDESREVNLSTPDEIAWWRSASADIRPVTTLDRAYDSPAIAHLERFFMSDEPRPRAPVPFSGWEGVRFMKASGRRAEAELVAEQIALLLRSGIQAEDIAVVVRSTSGWSRLLTRVFDSCSIVHHLDDRPLLAQTGLGHSFLNALKGICLADAGALLAHLRSPYSGLPLETVSDLELRYRRAPAKGATMLATIAADMGLNGVSSLWGLCPPRGESYSDGPRRLVRRMFAAAADGVVLGSTDLEEDARAVRTLESALGTLEGLGGSAAASERDAWTAPGAPVEAAAAGAFAGGLLPLRTVLDCLGSLTVGATGGEDASAVQILSVQRARARRFPVVFVLGLVEGEFPGHSDRPSLLSPVQRARLDAVGGGLFAEDADDEAALFVSALSRASRLLYLSTRDAEDDGSEASPSHFWTWAKDLLAVDEHDLLSRTLADQVFSISSSPTRRHYERACVAAGWHRGGHASWEARALPSWECVPRALADPEVLAELEGTRRFSPSALEAYAKCPFSWFIQKTVGAEELEVELDGRQVGTLVHSLLRSTYQELQSHGLLPLRAEGLTVAHAIADSTIERLVDGADCPGTAAQRRVAAWHLRRMVRNLFEMEVSSGWPFTPAELEMWVGSRSGVDLGGFEVYGRVDRVDMTLDGRGLFVLDYKSGAVPNANAVGSEEGLQLPLYLLALATERPRSSVLGGAYLALADKKRSGIAVEGAETLLGDAAQGCRFLDQTAMEELLQKTCDISLQAIEGMRSGVIAPREDRSCPPWCPLAPACRARRGGYRL